MPEAIHEGETVFLKPEQNLWDMRQATKIAMRDGVPKKRFFITHEDYYYCTCLDDTLSSPHQLIETALALGEQIVGEVDGAWKCAALWSLEDWTGILLHRERDTLFCTYLPLIDKETADTEHNVSMALAVLAREV